LTTVSTLSVIGSFSAFPSSLSTFSSISSRAMHVLRLPGTHHCITRDINDTLDSLGGIRVLFPLFLQLDNPIKLSDRQQISQDVDPQYLTSLLRIFCDMIRNNSSNQQFMQLENGFGVISYLMHHVSPENLTTGALHAMNSLVASVQFDTRFYRHAFLTLMFDVELWVYTAPAVRRAWGTCLLNVVAERAGLFREEILGVQRVVDALRSVCWFQRSHGADDDGADMVARPDLDIGLEAEHKSFYQASKKRMVGQRPNVDELIEFRASLLSLINEMVGGSGKLIDIPATHSAGAAGSHLSLIDEKRMDGPKLLEVRCMLNYVMDVPDERQKIDILGLFLTWMDTPILKRHGESITQMPVAVGIIASSIAPVTLHLIELGGACRFFQLLACSNKHILALTIEIISRLLIHQNTRAPLAVLYARVRASVAWNQDLIAAFGELNVPLPEDVSSSSVTNARASV
jgi:hypothetical protein